LNRITKISFEGEKIAINGKPTYEGRYFEGKLVEGLLFNVRAVQAIFDDENPETRELWRYPDTNRWDPDRNTEEFVKALPMWKEKGVLGFTVNLQGGMPVLHREFSQPWVNTAFKPDGNLKAAYLNRLQTVLDAADRLGMVVIVGLFYFGQDERLESEQAVINGVRNVIEWLLEKEYQNVIVEINNECDIPAYEHDILRPHRVSELILYAKEIIASSSHRLHLPVSTSFSGGKVPVPKVLECGDVVLVHGNDQPPERIRQMVAEIRSNDIFKKRPKPIIFNEDSVDVLNLNAAFESYSSWGYYDQGFNNYRDGFQSPPVCWEINTEYKKRFFNRVAEITGYNVS
jgi:hypothetical protein